MRRFGSTRVAGWVAVACLAGVLAAASLAMGGAVDAREVDCTVDDPGPTTLPAPESLWGGGESGDETGSGPTASATGDEPPCVPPTYATFPTTTTTLPAGSPFLPKLEFHAPTEGYSGPRNVGGGGSAVVSADGSYEAFVTTEGLVAEDTDGVEDVYRRDRSTGQVELVSRREWAPTTSGGTDIVGKSSAPTISEDGRYVAFTSTDLGLVALPDTEQAVAASRKRVFRFDFGAGRRPSPTMTWVSRPLGGPDTTDGDSHAPAISGDGQHVAFVSTANGINDLGPATTNGDEAQVHVWDADGHVTLVSTARAVWGTPGVEPTADSTEAAIDRTGSQVVFTSEATTLLGVGAPAGDTNTAPDVYRWRRGTPDKPELVSKSAKTGNSTGEASRRPSLAADGTTVAFLSAGSDLDLDADTIPDANEVDDAYTVAETATGTRTRRVSLTYKEVAPESASTLARKNIRLRAWAEATRPTLDARISPDGTHVLLVTAAECRRVGGKGSVPIADTNNVADTCLVDLDPATGNPADTRVVSMPATIPAGFCDCRPVLAETNPTTPFKGVVSADGESWVSPQPMSRNGTIVFTSYATNLRGPNGTKDVPFRDGTGWESFPSYTYADEPARLSRYEIDQAGLFAPAQDHPELQPRATRDGHVWYQDLNG